MMVLAALPGMERELLVSGDLANPGNISATVNLLDCRIGKVGLVFHIFGALAEFERNLIRERTQAGLQAARARGRHGGRPKALDGKRRALAVELYQQGKHTADEICRTVGITRPTLYAYINEDAAKVR